MSGCGKVLFSWYYWNWHVLFGTLIAYGQRRVSVYAFEGRAFARAMELLKDIMQGRTRLQVS